MPACAKRPLRAALGKSREGWLVIRKPALNRRQFVGAAAAAGLAGTLPAPAVWAQSDMELVHWSWLAASDAEVWGKMIDAFNEAHKGKGLQIKMEVIPEEQYV